MMPSPEQILSGLTKISNDWTTLAVFWHLYFALLLLLVQDRLPISRKLLLSSRLSGIYLAAPVLSVSILAWLYENPFNGTIFGVVGIALILIAMRLATERVSFASGWSQALGAGLFLFGWTYPHFLDTSLPWMYLYAAPTGLIPCPTLSISIGAALLFNGLGSRAWLSLIAVIGFFYGMYGALVLGVRIDLILVIGSIAAVFRSFQIAHPISGAIFSYPR